MSTEQWTTIPETFVVFFRGHTLTRIQSQTIPKKMKDKLNRHVYRQQTWLVSTGPALRLI